MFRLAAIALAALNLAGCMSMLDNQAIARTCGPDDNSLAYAQCAAAVGRARGAGNAPSTVSAAPASAPRQPVTCSSHVVGTAVHTSCF